jgi:hypothetical protein
MISEMAIGVVRREGPIGSCLLKMLSVLTSAEAAPSPEPLIVAIS